MLGNSSKFGHKHAVVALRPTALRDATSIFLDPTQRGPSPVTSAKTLNLAAEMTSQTPEIQGDAVIVDFGGLT